jgi:hypothetical protein
VKFFLEFIEISITKREKKKKKKKRKEKKKEVMSSDV